MKKGIIIAVVILAIVIASGIIEVIVLDKEYKRINDLAASLAVKASFEDITVDEYYVFMEEWRKVREDSELLLPHLDVYEINLRVTETLAAIRSRDFEYAYMQLSVIEELTRYVPHLMKPSIVHIL